jgi:hypothetical protein
MGAVERTLFFGPLIALIEACAAYIWRSFQQNAQPVIELPKREAEAPELLDEGKKDDDQVLEKSEVVLKEEVVEAPSKTRTADAISPLNAGTASILTTSGF